MKKISILLLSAAVMVITSCGGGEDKKPANVNNAKLLFAVGDVQVGLKEAWQPGQQNMPLTEGHEIKTGNSSQCNIVIGNDSYISIKEKSHVVLSTLFKNAAGTENTSVELKVGKTVVNPKKLLKGDEFRVKTPTAIAAVRGTQFVIDTKPQGRMKVAVVSGKVELKRRVPALENLEDKVVKNSDALTTLKEKVDAEAVVVEPNKSAFIDNKKVEQENKVIEKAVVKHVEGIKKQEEEKAAGPVPAQEEKITADKTAVDAKIKEEELKKELAGLDLMKEKKAQEKKAITIEEKIDKQDVEEVRELETVIKEEEKRKEAVLEEKKPEQVTELTVQSPVKGSTITVNGKVIGYNKVSLNPSPDAELSIVVTAKGYETWSGSVKLSEGEKKTINAEMIPGATLTVRTPVRNSAIYVDGRFRGRGKVTVSAGSGRTVRVEVRARGFKKYATNVMVHRGKSQVLNVAMEKNALLDRVRWAERVGRSVKTRPLSVKDRIVVATVDGQVVAMDKAGKALWKKRLGRTIESSPVAVKGMALVMTTDGRLFALSLDSGKTVWTKNLYGSLLFGSSPIIVGSDIYLATSYGRVYRISSNGKILWENDLENGIYSSPTYHAGSLYIGAEDHRIYALSASNGRVKWEVKLDGRMVASSPVISGSTLYLGSYKGTLFAVNTFLGKVKWKYTTSDAIVSSAAISRGRVYIGSSDGNLYCINSGSGKLQWKKATGSRILTTPLVKDRMVFVASGRVLLAMNKDSGTVLWQQKFEDDILSSPTLSGNEIYLGLSSGEVASIRIDLKNMVQ